MQLWYSSGSLSFMWVLRLSRACSLRNRISLLTVPKPTCNMDAISGWLRPWLDNSKTLFLRHCSLSTFVLKLSTFLLVKY